MFSRLKPTIEPLRLTLSTLAVVAVSALSTSSPAQDTPGDHEPTGETSPTGDETEPTGDAPDGGETEEGDGETEEGDGETEEEEDRFMPEEDLEPPDAAVGLAAPIPRPPGVDESYLEALGSYERALNTYELEVTEYRDDINRLVRLEYESQRRRIQDMYEAEVDAMRDEERAFRSEAIERLEAFLNRYPYHPPETPDAMFRLAELYFEKESDDFITAENTYDEQYTLYEMGRVPDMPELPEKDYTATISTFHTLIRDFPDYRQIDGAYYLMGYSMLQMDREDDAAEAFTALVSNFPDSDFAPEGWVRIGEYHFEINEYEEAVAAYGRAIDYGEWRLYDEALFKLGWSYYLSNHYTPALDTFVTLITYYDERRGESSGALREEALQYTAVVLAEEDWDMDGVRDALAGMPRIRETMTSGAQWELDVCDRLATIWFENDMFSSSVEMARFILESWPEDRLNPQRHEQIVIALSRMREFETAFEEQRMMADLYRVGSEWYRAQEEQGNIRAMAYADDLARRTLLESARYYDSEGQQIRDRAMTMGDEALDYQAVQQFDAAADGYAEFLEFYPDDRGVYDVQFFYAQSLYSGYHFLEAAEEYKIVRDWEGVDTYQELAGYQVVKCYETAIMLEVNAGYLDEHALPSNTREIEEYFAQEEDRDAPRVTPDPEPVPDLTLDLIQAYDTYVELGLNTEEDPTTQGRFAFLAARTFYHHLDFEPARERFVAVMDNPAYRCQDEALYSASFNIDTYRLLGDFENMELWSNYVDELDFGACGEDIDRDFVLALREEAHAMRLYGNFQSAMDLFDAEDYEAAAQEFARLVNQNPTSEHAADALYNGAVAYERVQRYEPAMRMYQRIYDEYPECPFIDDALERVAINSRRFFDFERAANTYLILADHVQRRCSEGDCAEEDEETILDSVFSAAELEGYMGRFGDSAVSYMDFSNRFPDDQHAPLALYRAGLMYERDESYSSMIDAWAQLRRRYGNSLPTEEIPLDAMIVDTLSRTAMYYRDMMFDPSTARDYFADVLTEVNRRGADDVDSMYAAGQARFEIVQVDFEDWNAIQIEGGQVRQRRIFMEQMEQIPVLAQDYVSVIDVGSAEWAMAGYYMVGRIYQAFADKMYAVPIPEECLADPVCEEAYIIELEDIAYRFEDEAVANWRVAMTVARELGIVNEWTIQTLRELNRYLGAEFPLFKEEQEFIQTDNYAPLPLLLPEPVEGGDRSQDDGIEEFDVTPETLEETNNTGVDELVDEPVEESPPDDPFQDI